MEDLGLLLHQALRLEELDRIIKSGFPPWCINTMPAHVIKPTKLERKFKRRREKLKCQQ